MARLRLDPMGLQDIFNGNDIALKLHALSAVEDGLYDWDIIPAKSLLQGLEDNSSEVRISTLGLICSWFDIFPEDAIEKLLDLITDPIPEVRLALLENLPNISDHIRRSDIVRILPLIKSKYTDIRSAVVQVCHFKHDFIDSDLFSELSEMYRQSDSPIQNDIYEILNSKGHGALLEETTLGEE